MFTYDDGGKAKKVTAIWYDSGRKIYLLCATVTYNDAADSMVFDFKQDEGPMVMYTTDDSMSLVMRTRPSDTKAYTVDDSTVLEMLRPPDRALNYELDDSIALVMAGRLPVTLKYAIDDSIALVMESIDTTRELMYGAGQSAVLRMVQIDDDPENVSYGISDSMVFELNRVTPAAPATISVEII